jgi:Zn finger protein HypA/HybF involved in hydrogenase expression
VKRRRRRIRRPLFGKRAGTGGHPLENIQCDDCGCTYRGSIDATARMLVSDFSKQVFSEVIEASCPACGSKSVRVNEEEMVVVEAITDEEKVVIKA